MNESFKFIQNSLIHPFTHSTIFTHFFAKNKNYTMPQRPPLSVKIMFAIGQLGWSLASFGVLNLIPYFYMPPESGKTDFPDFVYQGAVLGILTVAGLVNFGGRFFDAISDPIIANLSDKSNSKFGKRKVFLAIGALPFALLSVLIFMPISPTDTMLNTAWLMGLIVLFYLFFSMYVVPYNALIGELGHHPKDRMLISTLISVTWAVGFVLGGMIYAMQGHFETTGMTSDKAFQTSQMILSAIAFVCMLFPIFFLNEKRYCKQTTSSVNFVKSLKIVWANKNFRYFVFSDLTYWIAITIIQTGVIYYVTILLGMEKEQASLFGVAAFLLSFAMYIPINLAVAKFGKKPVIMLGFVLFAMTFLVSFFLGRIPLPDVVQFGLLITLSALPMGIFGIIPNAIIADIINQEVEEKGESQAGMFFAFRTFMMKLGASFALLIFPSLLLLGRSVENDFGIRLTGLVALFFCLLGLFLFRKYNDSTDSN